MDDCARLENVFTREGNGGSNPFLSAEKVREVHGSFLFTAELFYVYNYYVIVFKSDFSGAV